VAEFAQEPSDRRETAHRTNVMLAATLDACGRSLAVKVRNLSGSGALIESSVIPETDTAVVLRRGDLSVQGSVVWHRDNRCGVRFSEAINPAEWIKPGHGPVPISNPAQFRVDQIQAEARAGLISVAPQSVPQARRSMIEENLQGRLAEELNYVQRLIDGIGDELITEPIVVGRHQAALQKFDLASQILNQLARILVAPDPVEAASTVGMQELRARLLRL
jgi:PilZ domain-containing protein